MTYRVIQGDCVERMRELPDASIDAICTDPPYAIGFMGKAWDTIGDSGRGARARTERADEVTPNGEGHSTSAGPYLAAGVDSLRSAGRPFQEWCEQWAREALRVLKPGGHLLAFGGTRTYHRLAAGIEDAGFEIRDSIAWQHMDHVFCQCEREHLHGHGDVHGMRSDVRDAGGVAEAREGADVQPPVQRSSPGQGVGDAWPQGLGSTQDDATPEVRPGEPSVEGRRDAEAQPREPQGGEVRAVSGVGAADGASGRLRDGAPAADGGDVGLPADANGGRASQGPRCAEQRADEPRAVAVEWIPQGGGAWPGCPRCGKPLAPPFFGGPLTWEYGSGFPKSLDVSKAIDKAAGAEREVVGTKHGLPGYSLTDGEPGGVAMEGNVDGSLRNGEAECAVTAPATPEAQAWEGWGTALKPAHEPIVVARKPLAGTVASNCLAYGTGALNISATRIGTEQRNRVPKGIKPGAHNAVGAEWDGGNQAEVTYDGRWPANVVLDEDAAGMLDEQTGTLTSGANPTRRGSDKFRNAYGDFEGQRDCEPARGADSGGASRFFYCAKASSAERNAGLDGFEASKFLAHDNPGRMFNARDGGAGDEEAYRPKANVHPTVKPVELMRWLIRLVTPPGGTVLDPFLGSGTTGCAAVLERVEFIGIERDAEYVPIAEARIAWWAEHPDGMQLVKRLEAEREQKATKDAGQVSMFDLLEG